jgi:hypothetical protein
MFTRVLLTCSLFLLSIGIAQPQSSTITCTDAAVNPAVRVEGIAELLGDIVISCSGGSPGTVMTLNLAVFLNVAVTNRVSAAGATDVSLTVDSGSGPAPASVPAILQGSNGVSFNGFSVTIPASQKVNFRISNLRGNVSQIGSGFQQAVQAALTLTGLPLVSSLNPVSVGIPAPGLLASYSSSGIRCTGSALPSTLSFSNLFMFGTRFASTRVTEGFPSAFEAKMPTGDTGIRILARYSGFPPDRVCSFPRWSPEAMPSSPLPPATSAVRLQPALMLRAADRCCWHWSMEPTRAARAARWHILPARLDPRP